MISADCDLIRDDLDAFSDGELRGDDLRRVSEHVGSCRTARTSCTRGRSGRIRARRAADSMRWPYRRGWPPTW
jgi:anti-sigma factor RsiW